MLLSNSKAHAQNPEIYSPSMDLHTHIGAILPARVMAQIAVENGHLYPVARLLEMGFSLTKLSRIIVEEGEHSIQKVKLAQLFAIDPLAREQFTTAIRFRPGESHHEIDQVYKFRSSLIEDPLLCHDLLHSIASVYETLGIRYVEISSNHIVAIPDWLDVAAPIIQEIDDRRGISLRLLAGIRRDTRPKYFKDVLERAERLFSKPYFIGEQPVVMGYDINGYEDRDLADIRALIEGLNQIIGSRKMVKRIHAGELNNFPHNVKLALELGATRVAHGDYGFSPELVAFAQERGIILELMFSSNVLLKAISAGNEIPIDQFLENRLMLSLGTDGISAYDSVPQYEFIRISETGVSAAALAENLRRTDEFYLTSVNCRHRLRTF